MNDNMKNNDILLDVIGETDEKLIPELTEKKKPGIARWVAMGGACAAAVIACIALLPKNGGDGPVKTSPGSDTKDSEPSSVPSVPEEDTGSPRLLASPAYPEMAPYPDETSITDWDAYDTKYDEWSKALRELRDQPEGYEDGYDTFFLNSTQTFLSGFEADNIVYSPLSLYMALGMSAEITDGNSRQQILDALAQEDIDALRSHARSIWQANYRDDGMAKCVLANSLWTNSGTEYVKDTLDTLAETYYSSVYTGEPGTEEYDELFRSWVNSQTDGLLTEYVSDMRLDPEMLLTLASTVNYSGKWVDQFDAGDTEPGTFHSPSGDVQCDFMNAERGMGYYWGEHFTSVSLSLENNGHMKLILPDEGYSPYDLLADDQVRELMLSTWDYPNNKYVIVNMSVPKFDVSSSIDLKDGLSSMGITDIFDPGTSDFSPLTRSTDQIFLSQAEQDTRVTIDEDGCKAASLTVMAYTGAGMPEDYADFILDRPFIFEIMSDTGLPLFVGIVNTPVQ